MAADVSYSTQLNIAIIRYSNPPVNALGSRGTFLLTQAVKRAQSDGVGAIIITSAAPWPFSAGADIKEFGASGADGNEAGTLAELVSAVEESRIPVIAAIAGLAYGGGLELALGCHYRLAHPGAKLGLPEVKLGLLPGCGGTQRLPRLVGFTKALRMVVTGDPITAREAHGLGLVDEVISASKSAQGQAQDLVVEAALAYAHQRLKDGALRVRRTRDLLVPECRTGSSSFDVEAAVQQAIRELRMPPAERGGQAQHACVEAVKASVSLPVAEGLEVERTLFLGLLVGSQSQARRYMFLAERQTTRQHPPDDRALPVRSVAVVGGGTTGSGIVVCFLDTGANVTLVERDDQALARSVATIQAVYGARVRRGTMSRDQAGEAESRFRGVVGVSGLQADGAVDLVVEAVFEDLAVKQEVFRELDRVCPPHCVLASNTSSLDIDAIASATRRPAQVLGMHFFTPTHLMRLVEVVKGAKSSEQAIATVTTTAKRMKKVTTVVGNCPGFVGNRMLFPYKNETEFLVEDGASPYQVDRVLSEYGFPIGPFAMSDLAGLDISYKIRKARGLTDPSRRDPRERYCDLSDRLCEMGRLGQKTGKGWYKYEKKTGRTPLPDPDVLAFLDQQRRRRGVSSSVAGLSDEEVLERCLFPLVNEAFKILEEGIAACPSDIDVIWCSGYAWPVWRGGPMYWAANEVGLERVLAKLEHYHRQFPRVSHWAPAPLLRRLVSSKQAMNLLAKI